MEAEEREVLMEMMKNLFPFSACDSNDSVAAAASAAVAAPATASTAFSDYDEAEEVEKEDEDEDEDEDEEELSPRARPPPSSSSSFFPVAPVLPVTQLGKWTTPGMWRQQPLRQGQKQRQRKEGSENARVV